MRLISKRILKICIQSREATNSPSTSCQRIRRTESMKSSTRSKTRICAKSNPSTKLPFPKMLLSNKRWPTRLNMINSWEDWTETTWAPLLKEPRLLSQSQLMLFQKLRLTQLLTKNLTIRLFKKKKKELPSNNTMFLPLNNWWKSSLESKNRWKSNTNSKFMSKKWKSNNREWPPCKWRNKEKCKSNSFKSNSQYI